VPDWYVPAPHSVHDVAPWVAEYLAAAQFTQAAAPVAEAYEPAGHWSQEGDPTPAA
jgi:hypothetical protein